MNKLCFAALAVSLCVAGAEPGRADTTDGSCLESFELSNFQPASETFGQLVKSSSYRSRTTIFMLLSAG